MPSKLKLVAPVSIAEVVRFVPAGSCQVAVMARVDGVGAVQRQLQRISSGIGEAGEIVGAARPRRERGIITGCNPAAGCSDTVVRYNRSIGEVC